MSRETTLEPAPKPKTQRRPLTERIAFGTRKQRQTGSILTPRFCGKAELEPPDNLSKDALRTWCSSHIPLGNGKYRTPNRAERRSRRHA